MDWRDQAYAFIWTNAFTDAGQLRYVCDATTNVGLLEANTTGATVAEFQIDIVGKAAMFIAGFAAGAYVVFSSIRTV